jgi:hypothetical protein
LSRRGTCPIPRFHRCPLTTVYGGTRAEGKVRSRSLRSCLWHVGLIISGVDYFVDRDRWSAWRMMWLEQLPRALFLSGTY